MERFPMTRLRNPSKGRRGGFSLLELLVVIAIMFILLVYSAPVVSSLLESSRLAIAGQMLVDQLSLARQESSSRNNSVEVRFIKSPDGGYQALQMLALGTGRIPEPLFMASRLPEGTAISEDAALSPAFGALPMTTGVMPAAGPFASCPYSAFRIKPTGVVEPVASAPNRAKLYFTIVPSRRAKRSAVPPNYVTVQLNPDTATPLIYRP